MRNQSGRILIISFFTFAFALAIPCAIGVQSLYAGELVPVHLPGGLTLPCEVFKVSKDGVVLRVNDKQQTIPLDKLNPKDVAQCYKKALNPKDAALRFEMGSFFFTSKLFNEAEEELNGAVSLDAKYKPKAAALLSAIGALKEMTDPAKDDKKRTASTKKSGDGKDKDEDSGSDSSNEDFAAKFKRMDVPPRSAAEMKTFLDTQLEHLKEIGGPWRMIETKHFYCFSNVKEDKHRLVAQWDELFYNNLCDILKHKEGDKLWNNKCPIYYFAGYGQFQRFATESDGPGAAYSGGYFSAHGRDVHICIPFMNGRVNESEADRLAKNTLHHEGTHAFLQLTDEDVPLSRALHEGMAQFIEFWYDSDGNLALRLNNPERRRNAEFIAERTRTNNIPSWAEMKQRPMGGTDHEGYAWAWIKLEFLYRNFDKLCLPKMVHLIKSGKTEDEALVAAFGHPIDKMEDFFRLWLKEHAKRGFKFESKM